MCIPVSQCLFMQMHHVSFFEIIDIVYSYRQYGHTTRRAYHYGHDMQHSHQ